jgi:subtilisin family serine protease
MSSAPYGRGALFSLGGLLSATAMMLSACQDANSPTVSSPQSPNDPAVSFAATADQGLGRAIPGAYIVVFKSSLPDPAAEARGLVAQHGGTLRFTYTSAIKGFAADLPARAVDALRRNPNVAYVEADQAVELFDTESAPSSWGLDRVDQRKLPLSSSYSYTATGAGVSVYIIDTGIRTTHVEFGGRAVGAYSSVKGKASTDDCNGHGTHVAGTVGGSSYGIAKGVKLYAVRVLDCDGSGSFSAVIAGIDWVTAHRQLPAVANMSLGGGKSQPLNDAVKGSIAAGVTYAVAAGNSNYDACSFSPASTSEALTVGATTRQDAQAYYSNWGTCVDLYAPGDSITSAWNTSDTASAIKRGTSMAAPHVAGAAALYLESHPLDSPANVASALSAAATQAQITNLGSGSPNLLVFTGDPATAQPSPISGGGGGSKGCGNAWWKKC